MQPPGIFSVETLNPFESGTRCDKILNREGPKRILCTTDLSVLSNQAIPYGIALARTFDATLFICHVIESPPATITGDVHLYPIELQAKISLTAHNQIAELMGSVPVRWKPLILIGPTADEVRRIVGVKKIDLAVAATHGRSGIKRLILGSVAERLMRTLSCPLLVVRNPIDPPSDPAEEKFVFKRILVGCDFSPDAALALQYAADLAGRFESELHMVHVIAPPIYAGLQKPEIMAWESERRILRRKLGETLTRLIPEKEGPWRRAKASLLEGLPYKELMGYAKQNGIDLIVLGVRGLNLVESLCLGSTTDRVVRQSPCPVLTVRPGGQFNTRRLNPKGPALTT